MNEKEIREQIAQKIEGLHPDTSWTYDCDIAELVKAAAAIARGENDN